MLPVPVIVAASTATQNILLSLAGALVVLLWILVRKRDTEDVPKRRRRAPVSPEELARAVFEAAQRRDLELYRDLFLAGSEARQVYGDDAQWYLDRRSSAALKQHLDRLAEKVPRGSRFGGMLGTEVDGLEFKVEHPDGAAIIVPVGSVQRIKGVLRLVEPARTDSMVTEPA